MGDSGIPHFIRIARASTVGQPSVNGHVIPADVWEKALKEHKQKHIGTIPYHCIPVCLGQEYRPNDIFSFQQVDLSKMIGEAVDITHHDANVKIKSAAKYEMVKQLVDHGYVLGLRYIADTDSITIREDGTKQINEIRNIIAFDLFPNPNKSQVKELNHDIKDT